MADIKSTGIYICFQKNGNHDVIDYSEVVSYAKGIPGVVVWDQADISLTDIAKAASVIKSSGISRLVVAGDTPGMIKSFFARAMQNAGNDPSQVLLAGFKEHGAVKKADTDRAKAVVACTVKGVSFDVAAKPAELPVETTTLVIGAGIAGIQASLEVADAGHKVVLVEKSPTIGGYMATFDKTFPTLDCAACILTPKMVEVGQHANIDLMTNSEVKDVKGLPGNYKVKVLKKARRVDLSTCIGCGTCAEKCPVNVKSEFDAGTTMRKAIYIPFPQAVPNKYIIDEQNCTYLKTQKCGVCAKVCPVTDCINFAEKDEEIEITVGNIIVATGYKPFDAERDDRFGYGKYPNVLTSLEFERLINASGPTGGNIYLRTQDKKGNWIFKSEGVEPKSVAIIHCVGSRDENYNKYCSKVCCMYSLKLAHLVIEKLPNATVNEYFIDMRAFGKGYEEFYQRIKKEGVNIIRGRTAKVEEKEGSLWLRSEDIINDRLIEQQADMVVLSVGLEPREDAKELAKMLDISQAEDGWFVEENYVSNPVNTTTGGISVVGVCQGPKDIPDTVAQASASASRVLQTIINGKIKSSIKDISLSEIETNISNLS